MNSPQKPLPRPASRDGWRPAGWTSKLLSVCLILILSATVIFLWVASFGMVTGEEFSPDTFQSRSFIYHRFPILGVQVTPVFWENTTGPLQRHLRSQQLLPPRTGGRHAGTWYRPLVRASAAGAEMRAS